MKKIIFFTLFLSFYLFSSKAQLIVNQQTSMTQLVNNFILSGVTASNISFTGDSNAVGSFLNGNSTNLGMNDGIILTTGVINGTPAIGGSVSGFSNTSNNQPGDSLLGLLTTAPTYDAAVLEFDLVPVGNILEFQYVFASEEYPEYVNSGFNDIFGFFINGSNPGGGNFTDENIALIPGSNQVVCINNVNASTNSSYFVDNLALNGTSIVFDGFTTVLIAQASVVPLSTYHLKMAIADVSDGVFDSGIFLKAQSMKSYTITNVEEKKIPNFSISPNPLSADTKLSFNMATSGMIKVNITDITGKEVYTTEKSFDSGIQHLSLGEFYNSCKTGIHMIHIQTNDFSELLKIIKF